MIVLLLWAAVAGEPREAKVTLRPVASLPEGAALATNRGELRVEAGAASLRWRGGRLVREPGPPAAVDAEPPQAADCAEGTEGEPVRGGSARGQRCGAVVDLAWTHRAGDAALRLSVGEGALAVHGDDDRLALVSMDASGWVAELWRPRDVAPLRWVSHALPLGEPVTLPRWSPRRRDPTPALRVRLGLPATDGAEQVQLWGSDIWVMSSGASGLRLLHGRLPSVDSGVPER